MIGVVIVAGAFGAAMPLSAFFPAASAALFALQFLALAGEMPGSSAALASLSQPLVWLAPVVPEDWLLFCMSVLGVAALGRLVAVILHNSAHGSEKALPHGLSPGAWELRVLGLLVFPLSVASSSALFRDGFAL